MPARHVAAALMLIVLAVVFGGAKCVRAPEPGRAGAAEPPLDVRLPDEALPNLLDLKAAPVGQPLAGWTAEGTGGASATAGVQQYEGDVRPAPVLRLAYQFPAAARAGARAQVLLRHETALPASAGGLRLAFHTTGPAPHRVFVLVRDALGTLRRGEAGTLEYGGTVQWGCSVGLGAAWLKPVGPAAAAGEPVGPYRFEALGLEAGPGGEPRGVLDVLALGVYTPEGRVASRVVLEVPTPGGCPVLTPDELHALGVRVTNPSETPLRGTLHWEARSWEGRQWCGTTPVNLEPGRHAVLCLPGVPVDYGYYRLRVAVECPPAPPRSFDRAYVVTRPATRAQRRRFGLGTFTLEERRSADYDWQTATVSRLGAGWTVVGFPQQGFGQRDYPASLRAAERLSDSLKSAELGYVLATDSALPGESESDLHARMLSFAAHHRAGWLAWYPGHGGIYSDRNAENFEDGMDQVHGAPSLLGPPYPVTSSTVGEDRDRRWRPGQTPVAGYLLFSRLPLFSEQVAQPQELTGYLERLPEAARAVPCWVLGLAEAGDRHPFTDYDPERLARAQAGRLAAMMLSWAVVMRPDDRWHYTALADPEGAFWPIGLFGLDHQPKPAAAAFATAASLLGDARLLSCRRQGDLALAAFQTGRGPLTACWREPDPWSHKRPSPLTVTVHTRGGATRISVVGTETPLPPGRTLQMRLVESPVYFLGEPEIIPPTPASR